MANLIVANVCDLNCSYCFAGEHLSFKKKASDSVFISMDTFEERLEFLERSEIDQIRIIGGEPTLHPKFSALIHQAHLRNKPIAVFSHGLIPSRSLTCLESLSPDECTVLVNTNATKFPKGPVEEEQVLRYAVIKRLGPRVLPGFNIYSTNFQLDFLLDLIQETGCRKAIRLGLAHPSLSGENTYLHPKQYPVIGHKIAKFARVAAKFDVKLEFDCGFVRCMFSEDDYELLLDAKADIGWRCNPILDVDINGQVFHCFPLAEKAQMHLSNADHASIFREQLAAQMAPYRQAGIYRECSTCPFKQSGDCRGGCLTETLRRFRRSSVHLAIPESEIAFLSMGRIRNSSLSRSF